MKKRLRAMKHPQPFRLKHVAQKCAAVLRDDTRKNKALKRSKPI
jgi:hypothetical protein